MLIIPLFLSGCPTYRYPDTNGTMFYDKEPGDDGLYPIGTRYILTCDEGFLISNNQEAQCIHAVPDNGIWYYGHLRCGGNKMNTLLEILFK